MNYLLMRSIRPGDMPNQCAAGFNCPPPTLTIDPFNPFGNVYVDISAAGPNSFDFKATTNVSWLSISTKSGSITRSKPEMRIFLSVADWSQLASGSNFATINFTASATKQPSLVVPVDVVAQNTKPSLQSSFKGMYLRMDVIRQATYRVGQGFVESTGVVAIEAASATRNTSVDGITWTELPGIGRTVSGITPWPRTGNDGSNFTAGAGPSMSVL
jgi:hypothetical protein